jgi:hypothetical protein
VVRPGISLLPLGKGAKLAHRRPALTRTDGFD